MNIDEYWWILINIHDLLIDIDDLLMNLGDYGWFLLIIDDNEKIDSNALMNHQNYSSIV
jgi:hypothetical protein